MKTTYKKSGIIVSSVIGTGITIFTSLLLTAAVSWGIISEHIPVGMARATMYCVFFGSVLLGATVAIKCQKKDKLISNYVAAILYFLILISLNVVITDGKFDHLWINFLLTIAGASLPILKSPKQSKARFKRKSSRFVQH